MSEKESNCEFPVLSKDGDKELEPPVSKERGSAEKKFSNFYVLKDDKIHVVSNSEDCKEICVWSIVEQKAVRRLYGECFEFGTSRDISRLMVD